MALKQWIQLVVDGSQMCKDAGKIVAEYALVRFAARVFDPSDWDFDTRFLDVRHPIWSNSRGEGGDVSEAEVWERSWQPVWDGVFIAPFSMSFAKTLIPSEKKDNMDDSYVELRFYPSESHCDFKIAYYREWIRGENGFNTQYKEPVDLAININDQDHREFVRESLADGMKFRPRKDEPFTDRTLLLHEQASLEFWAVQLLSGRSICR